VAKVLVVDDEPDILLILQVNLEAAGFEVVVAGDGQEALDRIRDDRPDVVVLDVMMPVLDGWEVLQALQPQADAPPVIVLSAKFGDQERAHAYGLGAVDYLNKPFDPVVLLASIRRVLAPAAS